MRQAKNIFIQQSQTRSFPSDVRTKERQCSLKHQLSTTLKPYLDDKDVLRVEGRLTKYHLEYSYQHPIILHHKDKLTHMIIKHYHVLFNHEGPTYLLTLLRRKYHIVSGRRLIRSVCRSCVICLKQAAKTQTQLMGVDFAGVILAKYAHVHKPVIKTFVCLCFFLGEGCSSRGSDRPGLRCIPGVSQKICLRSLL